MHYTAQHTGQKGITHHAIPDKKGITQHAIPDKKSVHGTTYRTKKLTDQNIPDKTLYIA
jgi:hypothetical protein